MWTIRQHMFKCTMFVMFSLHMSNGWVKRLAGHFSRYWTRRLNVLLVRLLAALCSDVYILGFLVASISHTRGIVFFAAPYIALGESPSIPGDYSRPFSGPRIFPSFHASKLPCWPCCAEVSPVLGGEASPFTKGRECEWRPATHFPHSWHIMRVLRK